MATLRNRMTETQGRGLEEISGLGHELLILQSHAETTDTALFEQTQLALDRACLLFCVSLIDHTLKGDLFESVVVGLLAVEGIDVEKRTFKPPADFTPLLSGLIKIGQMLIMQRAVVAVENGEVTYVSDMLDDMHRRLLTGESPSPIGWAIWLRAYGKKMKNATTVAGHIRWSEDGLEVEYKEKTVLQIDDFKAFVHLQVQLLSEELTGLLLLQTAESSEDVVPAFSLRDLRDDSTNRTPGWNFLQCSANRAHLPDGSRKLLLRVLNNTTLRDAFLKDGNEATKPKWNATAVKAYLNKIDTFLERLLMVIHFTSGQPARGSELLTLCHSNGSLGQHRNIFIEQGMIATVTSYHKGYSTTGSTKIIHRYLPTVVGEVLIYYLWLILPFWQQLRLLTFHENHRPSTYLWPSGEMNWTTARLTRVLEREASAHLRIKLNTAIYRHLAIAISLAHLPGGSFRREYPIEQRVLDRQAAHSSWEAALTYAREVGDRGGHMEQRREQYRKASCEWHRFLGFPSPPLAPRKRPISDLIDIPKRPGKRVKGIASSTITHLIQMRDLYADNADANSSIDIL